MICDLHRQAGAAGPEGGPFDLLAFLLAFLPAQRAR
jgi:hypothetical protein